MQIAQLVAALPYQNGSDFPGQPAVTVKENVNAMITRSGKTMVEPKTEAEVEVESSPEKEEENLGKASPKDISDTHLLPFPHQAKKPAEDEKFSHFVEVIWRMYAHIPMLDTMQVPTYARYLKDILNQK
jgi:hypothetical protein